MMAVRELLVGAVSCLAMALATHQVYPALEPLPLEEPLPVEWPCPMDNNIAPCICTADEFYNLTMDCTAVQSTTQLERIFQELFPFIHFLELKIDHDPEDINNQLESINAHTFQKITFERIIIRGTQLNLIADEAFAESHEYLRYLDLSNNQLASYPFESMPEYVVLNTFIIDDNHFIELPALDSASLEVFSGSGNNNMVVNKLAQFVDAPSLREIRISKIGMTELRTEMFLALQYLQVVDLSDNHLVEVEMRAIESNQTTLTYINLNFNKISYVRHDSIVGLLPTAVVHLAHNNVTELKQDSWQHVFNQLKTPGSLDLEDNPLTCGCDMDWIMLDAEDSFRPLLTDTTTCYGGQIIIFLELDNFCAQCGGSAEWEVCP